MKAQLILDDRENYHESLYLEQITNGYPDVISIHPSQIDEVILFLLAHKKQVEELENKE